MRKQTMFACMSFLIACDNEEIVQTPIDSDVLIEVKEVASDPNRILIIGKTEKEYNCYNNTIATTKKSIDNTIEITFKAVEGNERCANALGPATTKVELGNGEYMLQLNTATAVNEGLLKVTATEIRLEFNQQEGINILTPVVQR